MPYFKNDKINVLFIHIPKTGGSFIESLYSKKYNTPMNMKTMYMFDNSFSTISLQHQTLSTIYANKNRFKIVMDDSLVVLTCIRNPYTRFISQMYWVNKIKNGTTPDQIETLAREYFKKYDRDPHIDDNHLLPQHMFLKDTNGVIDTKIKILRQETLNSDLMELGFSSVELQRPKRSKGSGPKSPGPTNLMQRVLNNVKPSVKPVVKSENYYTLFNMKTIELVNKYYKEDFELFKYEMITTEEQLRQRI